MKELKLRELYDKVYKYQRMAENLRKEMVRDFCKENDNKYFKKRNGYYYIKDCKITMLWLEVNHSLYKSISFNIVENHQLNQDELYQLEEINKTEYNRILAHINILKNIGGLK